MKIAFDQSPSAIRAINIFDGWDAPEKKTFRLRTRLTGGIVLFFLPMIIFSMTSESFDFSVFLNLLLFSVLLFLLGFAASRHTVLNRIETKTDKYLRDESNADAIGPREIEIAGDLVNWKTSTSRGSFPISEVQKVHSAAEYYFMYFRNNPAWVIPKSAMGSRERGEFEGLMKNCLH